MLKQQINLFSQLPKSPRFSLNQRTALVCYALFLSFLFLDYIYFTWEAHLQEKKKQSLLLTITQKKNTLAQLMKQYPIFNEKDLTKTIEELQKSLNARVKIFTMLAEEGGFSYFLMGLSQTIVPNVWLNQITILNRNTHIDLMGYASSPLAVQHFLDNLKKSSVFSGMSFALQELIQIPQQKEKSAYLSFRASNNVTSYE